MAFSDGNGKTKTEIYRDRNVAVVGLLRALDELGYEVGFRKADEPKWPAVYAIVDPGEVGWHIPVAQLDEFGSWLPRTGREYNEYSRETKNDRLIEFIQEGPHV